MHFTWHYDLLLLFNYFENNTLPNHYFTSSEVEYSIYFHRHVRFFFLLIFILCYLYSSFISSLFPNLVESLHADLLYCFSFSPGTSFFTFWFSNCLKRLEGHSKSIDKLLHGPILINVIFSCFFFFLILIWSKVLNYVSYRYVTLPVYKYWRGLINKAGEIKLLEKTKMRN